MSPQFLFDYSIVNVTTNELEVFSEVFGNSNRNDISNIKYIITNLTPGKSYV